MFIDEEQREAFRHIWAVLDTSGDGVVTVVELTNELRASGLTNRAIDRIIAKVDTNRDGAVSFEEFLTTLSSADAEDDGALDTDETRGIFNLFDQNGDGEIDTAEMAMVLISMGMTGISTEEICYLLEAVDADKSGKVSFDEFQVVANFVQVLSEKKFELHMMRRHLEILERKVASSLAELAAKGEKGWQLETANQAEEVKAKIVKKEHEMNKLTTEGGFGSLMMNFLDQKAAEENGFTSVSKLFEYIPMKDPHFLRETMQKSGRVVESLPDGFILGNVKQNRHDWVKTVTLPKAKSKSLSQLDHDLRAVFLFYCDKESHSMSSKSFLRFAADISAIPRVPASRVQLCFTSATHQSKPMFNCQHDQQHLNYREWKFAILALLQCLNGATMDKQQLHLALQSIVLSRAKCMKSVDNDKLRLANGDVGRLMRKSMWTLKILFDHYSSISSTHPGAFCMSIGDFAAFLRDFNLMGGSSPVCTSSLIAIFKKAKNLSDDLELQRINFSQFLECLGRCALLLFPSGKDSSEQLLANKAAVYFQGESAKSINYVQRYLSRTNHFRAIQYSPRPQSKNLMSKSSSKVNSKVHDKCTLPRMPVPPFRTKPKSQRRIRRVLSKKRKTDGETAPKPIYSTVHISPAGESVPENRMTLPDIYK